MTTLAKISTKIDTALQEISSIKTEQKNQGKMIEKLDKSVNGNGKPGMKQDIAVHGAFMESRRIWDRILATALVTIILASLTWAIQINASVAQLTGMYSGKILDIKR